MRKPTTLAEHEQHVHEWGERGPSHAIRMSEDSYDRLTREQINLNVGMVDAPRNNVPANYVEQQKDRTFVTLPPSQYHPNGN